MIIVPYSFNPNRSLDRCVYSFPLIQVSLCHISITFGILSPSLSRLSLLCLRQRCGQSARNKHHLHHLEGRIKFQPSIADAGARGHFVFQTIHILFLGIPTHLVCLLKLCVAGNIVGCPHAAAEKVAFESGFAEAGYSALQAAFGTFRHEVFILEGGGEQIDFAETVVLWEHGVHTVDEGLHLAAHLVVVDRRCPADHIGVEDTLHNGGYIVLEDAGSRLLTREAADAEFYLLAAQRDELYLMPSSFIDRATVPILKKYLNNERLSLTQIAELMNFTSLSYFSRYCTKHLGQSPSDYRLSLQPK